MQSLVSGLFASRILCAAADDTAQSGMSPPEPVKAKGGGVVTVVKVGDIVPPRVAPPCKPGSCLCAGQSVTVIVSDSVISSSILEGKKEFEAATGARLNINRAPFSEVIGPDNPQLYWFDPQTMKPLIERPGHVRALAALVDLVQFGPQEMFNWVLGKSWDHFLAGRAAITFTWETYLKAGWNGADVRDYLHAYFDTFGNRQPLPYLRIAGTCSYWQGLDFHLAQARS